MNIIKLNDIKSTELDTTNLIAVSTDLRDCISPKYSWLYEEMWIIDCLFKDDEQIVLKYDYRDLEAHDKDFERLASLKHVNNQYVNAL